MSKRPILLISTPSGHKAGRPVLGSPSRLIDPETRETIPGIGSITLNIPVRGVLSCSADILLGGIEMVEHEPRQDIVQTEVTSDGRVIASKPLDGQDYITVADALKSQAEPITVGKAFVDIHVATPAANDQAEPGNGEPAPK